VILVDDGSGEEGARACAAAADAGRIEVLRRARNGGKGAAVLDGLARARELGYSHAFQIDGDGQHDATAIPRFLAASKSDPRALVLGTPEYNASAPRARTFARGFQRFWVGLETGWRADIRDAMIGFRVYPIDAALASGTVSRRMDFDVEILVRLVRGGTPVVSLPVAVRYLSSDEGGVSHFRMLRDNLAFARLHARLTSGACLRWLGRRLRGSPR
jgi:polyprenyl-phospho-N-acetylgalactosaminyl synthase